MLFQKEEEEEGCGRWGGLASLLQLPTAFVMNDDGKSGSSISASTGPPKILNEMGLHAARRGSSRAGGRTVGGVAQQKGIQRCVVMW